MSAARLRRLWVLRFQVVRGQSFSGRLQPDVCQPFVDAEDLAELDGSVEIAECKLVLIPRNGRRPTAPDPQGFEHFILKIIATIWVRHPGNVPLESAHAGKSRRVGQQERKSATETFQHRQ